jgi:hypothetical protein
VTSCGRSAHAASNIAGSSPSWSKGTPAGITRAVFAAAFVTSVTVTAAIVAAAIVGSTVGVGIAVGSTVGVGIAVEPTAAFEIAKVAARRVRVGSDSSA